VFNGDKTQALTTAASALVTTCATDRFAVSFTGSSGFTLPEGRSRVYLENVDAANAADRAQQTGVADTDIRVVFITDMHDTRFDAFGVLRPLSTVR